MDFGNDRLVNESIVDNEEFRNLQSVRKPETIEVHDNGSYELGTYNDKDGNVKGSEVSTHEKTPLLSPSSSSSSMKKGFGLKKWKRIKRDVNKTGDPPLHPGQIMSTPDLPESAANPSKRPQVYAERPQKSMGSVSPPNALVGSVDFLGVLGDSCMPVGLSIDTGGDSENSEDQSSKSSTAGSVSKVKYDKSLRVRGSSGKNLANAAQRGLSGKVRSEAVKKAREEEQVVKEDNSRSSMESDSRSSNFVFMQGTFATTSNGIRGDEPGHYDAENVDQVNDGLSDGCRKDIEGGYEGTENSDSKVKTERTENGSSSSNQDPLVESIAMLQSAQEALEQEVLKFKEVSSDTTLEDTVSDEVTAPEQKVEEMNHGLFQFSIGTKTAKEYAEADLEDLFKRKIAAEVEYLTISRTIQNFRGAAGNQTATLKDQSTSQKNQILQNHRKTDNDYEDTVLRAKAEKLEKFSREVASRDEILKLRRQVCKYTLYFLVQLFGLVILRVLFSLPDYAEDVAPPT
ncbi:WPP domain-interacting protein 2-like isoform X1 [Andrographis paniculata]|uniref:WPP domain-interacting protein 2-like isoform X1 n=1 Tax=Andrographis paniculata TaxID=175694 RepID=UPI0021E7D2CB|nr:WPP domain-interacting protein 2-like isoform X1 [Andrographis paniculata]